MEESNRPKLWIKRNPKWSIISYDFWHMGYDLKDETRKVLYDFVDKIVQESKSRILKYCCFGRTSGFVVVRTDFLPIFESIIKEKIFDKNNWVEVMI